jgi:hypothetical protein
MITDISLKYPEFVFPESVSLSELSRLVTSYSIPSSIPVSQETNIIYSPSLDIRSPQFDPNSALQSRQIFSSNLHSHLVDNLSKARFLLPGAPPAPTRKEHQPKTPETKLPNIHILDKIAFNSSKEKVVSDDGEISLKDSPLALLDKFMKEKKRIRVLVRRRNRWYPPLFIS